MASLLRINRAPINRKMRRQRPQPRHFQQGSCALAFVGAFSAASANAEPSSESSPIVVEATVANGESVAPVVEAQLLADLAGEELEWPDGNPLHLLIADDPGGSTAFLVAIRYQGETLFSTECDCSAMDLQAELPSYVMEALQNISTNDEAVPVTAAVAGPLNETRAREQVPPKRGDLALFGSGVALTCLGIGSLSTGAASLITTAVAGASPKRWAVGTTVAGAIGIAIGVPVLVVGERRTRRKTAALRINPTLGGLALTGRF